MDSGSNPSAAERKKTLSPHESGPFPGGEGLSKVLEAVGSVSWSALGFQPAVGSPVLATRMLASVLVHAYSQGRFASEEIEEACLTGDDFRYLCSGDAPEARVFRRFRRLNASALVESLSILMAPAGSPNEGRGVSRDWARQCLESAIAADSLALDL